MEWYPDDIKALATLAWSTGRFRANQISGRCDAKDPKTFPNGRLSQQECFDTNPATFHLALANLIGRHGVPFIMDAAYDYEVWNHRFCLTSLSILTLWIQNTEAPTGSA